MWDAKKHARQVAAPGRYQIAPFIRALAPLWQALALDPADDADLTRAASISRTLYQGLGQVLALEQVHDAARALSDEVGRTGKLPDLEAFLPEHRRQATLDYLSSRHPDTSGELRKRGYVVRHPRRPG